MYIYNYIHIWLAARNVKNPPANNYAENHSWPRTAKSKKNTFGVRPRPKTYAYAYAYAYASAYVWTNPK